MSSGNVHRIDNNDETPVPADGVVPGVSQQCGPQPHPAAPHAGELGATLKVERPLWDAIGQRGEREGWRDRDL
jgi:hypothetical protein